MSVDLSTTATVPAGTTLDVIVFEDTSQNGEYDNYEVASISDGTNTVTLSTLSGGTGNDYWIQPLATPGSAASLDSATVDTATGTTPPGSVLRTTTSNALETDSSGVLKTK